MGVVTLRGMLLVEGVIKPTPFNKLFVKL